MEITKVRSSARNGKLDMGASRKESSIKDRMLTNESSAPSR